MGIHEARIEDTAKLITDVKQQITSVDINIKPETVKFVIGDNQIKLGKTVKESNFIIVSYCTFDYHRNILLVIIIIYSKNNDIIIGFIFQN